MKHDAKRHKKLRRKGKKAAKKLAEDPEARQKVKEFIEENPEAREKAVKAIKENPELAKKVAREIAEKDPELAIKAERAYHHEYPAMSRETLAHEARGKKDQESKDRRRPTTVDGKHGHADTKYPAKYSGPIRKTDYM